MKKDTAKKAYYTTLVGRCFHAFAPTKSGERRIQHQGIVQTKVTDETYLVQYLDNG
jgi:hypothetical protein